jgi:membrane-bound lytic murein transglycosylase D
VYAHYWMVKYRQRGENLFHAMKAAEVQSLTGVDSNEARASRRRREELEQNYDKYIQRLYDRRLNEKDRLILRITRLFGECEISAPAEYMREVNNRIREWQSTSKFVDAVSRADRHAYTERIVRDFRALELPPQYFYLALQESGFDEKIVGPPTRWGHAKGMWQFIADTAQTHGLRLGPNPKSRAFEPEDERFNWTRSTVAATRYIRSIYATDAQASGLLVMASYNWGERRVVERLRKMPADPTERNFWNLLRNYSADVPTETRNYVFRIVAAAVIGENPRLFGFDIDNPLKRFDPAAATER